MLIPIILYTLKDCLFVMDIRDLQGIVSDCEFDTCITDDDDNSVLCGMAGKLVEVCAQKYGIQITEWRDITFCREFLTLYKNSYQQQILFQSTIHTEIVFLLICIIIYANNYIDAAPNSSGM